MQFMAYFVSDFSSSLQQRLGAGEWFTARVSACGLFHIAYPSAPELLRSELRVVYNQLCHDDMPMVRRSAALNLGKFAATVEPMYLKSDIMTFFRDLTQDGKPINYAHYFTEECWMVAVKHTFCLF